MAETLEARLRQAAGEWLREVDAAAPISARMEVKIGDLAATVHLLHDAAEAVASLRGERDRYQRALNEIERWSRAYPVEVFPEPDMVRVRELLAAGGITLDAVSASNMRHVIRRAGEIARAALTPTEDRRP